MDDTKILMLTQGELLGANLFAYCGNNPVMYVDPWGYFGFWVNVSTDLVSWILDVAISFAGFAIAAKGVFDMIKLIKSGRVYIRTSMEKALKKACLGALTGFLNTVFTVLDRFTKFSSIGGIIANTIDWLDGKYDGRIKFYVKLW